MPFIPLEVFANNPSTTVSSGGTSAPSAGTAETWTVASSASFPVAETGAMQFHVADPAQPGEVITVVNVSGTTWTVTRGAESSPVSAHSAGFTVVQVVTAGALAGLAFPPWQFPVQRYGAQGDGKIGAGGTGTSGTSTFTDSAASFVNAAAPAGDIGKYIIINQGAGGSATNPFCGTITAVGSATSVTLSGNLAATCASAPYIYGTDDAAAINAAVAAAAGWATATGNYKAQVVFQPGNYMLGAVVQSTAYTWAPFNSGSFTYNTQIPVPFAGQFDRKLVIDFIGVGDASEPDYWESVVPSLSGTCLVSASFATGQPNGTYGSQSVVGGPSANTGMSPGLFANVLVNFSGISVVCPWNAQQVGIDFRYLAQANVPNASYLAFAPVNYNGNTCGGPYLASTNLVTNGQSVGLAMPLTQNNDNCNVGTFTAEGCQTGMTFAEHLTAQRYAAIYCVTGLLVNVPASVIHGASILYASIEACGTSLAGPANAGTQFPIFIGQLDTEVITSTDISDPNNGLTGAVYWADFERTTMTVTGASGLTIINTRLPPGPWAGAPAAPASATAQRNTAYRTATVYLAATTGITVIATGPASTGLTTTGVVAGSAVTTQVRVPSGHYYAVTYTGTLTTKWVLE